MRTSMPNAGGPAYYSVKQAAWILGVDPSTIFRAIRVGTLRSVRRRGRRVIPASALTRLLGAPIDSQDGTPAEDCESGGRP
jgi:excisionase family DNA binding protein